ncbi:MULTISPECIES: LexA family protein [Acinetobacter]|jgi:DNA polymerase V|uniref:DNA polymerase V n=1 Tax=Acinetobacter lwoffii TaxID=28090 RepID=A0AAW8LCL2_ACILW|nr:MULTISPECIES: translesion error-prone DNA polymerase V autoproteolytic subunit [Acinetobacter]KGH47724.1 DNA polymerase V [Acinetobacter idrijaensis]MCJ8512745.1 translesion error-prone DNA polymerase V autoproteolytic subunit [Acinetobacter lwoffii]MCK4077487.1 translesion error-prone DNA polymerase V autoproteolytic subunit [Acinetobacter radioresistens]MCO8092622.1 translesion error-prone DNA polymerase V autoproteolytic subunit [Acinetobacter lwoffii]MCO8112900.1 translesion error-prone
MNSTHGGFRAGAGRKKSEETKVIRVPESKILDIKEYLESLKKENEISDIRQFDPVTKIEIPLATERVQAGFPSPAQDYIDKKIDLNEYLINNANATFIVRADSLSMLNAGIDINDALVVDRSIQARHRDIVIASIDNELTVKRLIIDAKGCWLKAENEGYPDIHPQEGQQFEIWGVVTNVIKKFR